MRIVNRLRSLVFIGLAVVQLGNGCDDPVPSGYKVSYDEGRSHCSDWKTFHASRFHYQGCSPSYV